MSSSGDKRKGVLVIGVGNPLRSDDGAGPCVVEQIEAKHWPGIDTWIVQQLQLEDLDRMLAYDQVILVDASVSGPPLDFRPLEKSSRQTLPSSHHLSAELFVNLASEIY
ncbi:MAG: hydrogenase maturation protease, partial [Candidatus Omnitrophica bacterium]|nr:hydrogenase maturation protease [Candidatus Omnitrophota bacterium]